MSAAIKPTGWDAKHVAIALSAERRAALRAFADSVEPGMSKAEALYALMDIALPSAACSHPQSDAASELARMSAAVADRCAAALEQVSLALAPLDGLISDEQGPTRKSAEPSGLAPAEWIHGALARLGTRPERLALTLSWLSTRVDGRRVELLFSVSRMQLDEQAFYTASITLPPLAISAALIGPLADISPSTLTAGAALHARPSATGWSCELRSAGSASRPPLHRFDC